MAKRTSDLTDQLRAAVEAYRGSRNELAKRAGVDATALSRFMTRQRNLMNDDMDKLGRALGLRIASRRSATNG
jgi:hypothetical protein